jgi:hypothetical protein
MVCGVVVFPDRGNGSKTALHHTAMTPARCAVSVNALRGQQVPERLHNGGVRQLGCDGGSRRHQVR